MNPTIVVNILGGPGIGKSSLAADVYCRLKALGVNCELVREVAKDLAWQGLLAGERPVDELFILAKQNNKQHNLVGKVSVIITDAPLIMKHTYPMKGFSSWHELVTMLFQQYHNKTYLLRRCKPYSPEGRTQTEDEAVMKDLELQNTLNAFQYPYNIVMGDTSGAIEIVNDIIRYLGASE